MKKSKILLVLLVLALFFALVGCSSTTDTSDDTSDTDTATEDTDTATEDADTADEDADTADSDITIGYSVYNLEQQYFQTYAAGIQAACDEMGFGYLEADQQADTTKMVSTSTDLIAQGIDALVISPCDPGAMGPVIAACEDAGIPCIIGDVGSTETGYDAFVVSANYGGGKLAGEYVVDNVEAESMEYALIEVELSIEIGTIRGTGFSEILDAAGWTMVSSVSGNSKQEEAYSIMTDTITANPDVEVVFCENDPMAIGAAQACADAGRDDIIVVGFNGDDIGLEGVESGLLLATVAQQPYAMGEMCVQIAEQLINGEEVTYDNEETKEIYVDCALVTADNVADYM